MGKASYILNPSAKAELVEDQLWGSASQGSKQGEPEMGEQFLRLFYKR